MLSPLLLLALLSASKSALASPISEIIDSIVHPQVCEFSFGTGPAIFTIDSLDRIVTFGDSSTDSGRGWNFTGGLAPPENYYHHMFSNGPVYPVLLSERLSLPLLGLAIGGATSNNTRAPGQLEGVPVPSSIEQVDSYLSSSDGAKSKLAKTLHIILVGQNNINANPATTGADAVTDITYSVKKVIKAGAQHILLYNSLDLGVNTPYALSAPTAAPFLSAWAISFRNEMFKNFPPWGAIGANPYVAVVDIYALANILLTSYEQFGLNESTKGIPCVIGTDVCDDAGERQFWDSLHPTARIHSLFAAAGVATMRAKGWVN
ncbi:hypothetical protein BDY24DRAFT_370714 [Mrakia frigida]|uniref:uncharacterized protein n=1 Tax=Mrakia frigida TaxID=29902 RepID=UPI003FCC1C26